jgi:hypothetical protein
MLATDSQIFLKSNYIILRICSIFLLKLHLRFEAIILFLLLSPALLFAQNDKEKKIISQMLTACEEIKGAKYLIITNERKKSGKMDHSELLVKIKTHPNEIYVYSITPDPGAEALWREGKLNNNVLINPNGFPFINLKLNRYNSLLRKDSHHTIKDLGFDYILTTVRHYENKLGAKFYSYLSIADTIQWDGRKLLRLIFDYTDFAYLPYTVRKDENATTISMAHYVNDYMIVCANPHVNDFHDVKTNQEILIPNCFGKKIIFGIDLKTMLPLLQEVYDDKGLFERYELKSFVINPKFEPGEFTPEFKDYHF